jgi:hypothetical protein
MKMIAHGIVAGLIMCTILVVFDDLMPWNFVMGGIFIICYAEAHLGEEE